MIAAAGLPALFGRLLLRLERAARQACIARLKYAGQDIVLGRAVEIEHPEFVSLGDGVCLGDYCWLSVLDKNLETGRPTLELHPELTIGDGTYVGRFGTIACINRVAIGRNVLISDRVYIGDSLHGFERRDLPIKDQYMVSRGPVEIGDGTWIGIGVSILPNVKIGLNCVVGAGSVVTRDIPDYCVAAGVPARVIKPACERR